MRGFTFYFVIGRYAAYHVSLDKRGLRIVLGFVAINFATYDIEVLVYAMHEKIKELKAEGGNRL